LEATQPGRQNQLFQPGAMGDMVNNIQQAQPPQPQNMGQPNG
jgi:hypothetical protein